MFGIKIGVLILISHTQYVLSVLTYPPIWLTSNYLQAGSYMIIDSSVSNKATGNSSTPKGSITFGSSFSAPPNLGYGISRYEGNLSLN